MGAEKFKFHTVRTGDYFMYNERNYMKVILPDNSDAAVDVDSGIVYNWFQQSTMVEESMLMR